MKSIGAMTKNQQQQEQKGFLNNVDMKKINKITTMKKGGCRNI